MVFSSPGGFTEDDFEVVKVGVRILGLESSLAIRKVADIRRKLVLPGLGFSPDNSKITPRRLAAIYA